MQPKINLQSFKSTPDSLKQRLKAFERKRSLSAPEICFDKVNVSGLALLQWVDLATPYKRIVRVRTHGKRAHEVHSKQEGKPCFKEASYASATRQRISTRIRACEHSCQNFASTLTELNVTTRYSSPAVFLVWSLFISHRSSCSHEDSSQQIDCLVYSFVVLRRKSIVFTINVVLLKHTFKSKWMLQNNNRHPRSIQGGKTAF